MKSKTEQVIVDSLSAVAAEKELRRDLRRGAFKGDYVLPLSEKPNPFLEEAKAKKANAALRDK